MGFVTWGCGDNPTHTLYEDISSKPLTSMQKIAKYNSYFLTPGVFLQAVFLVFIHCIYCNTNLQWIAAKTHDKAYRYYGLIWSFATVSLLGSIGLLCYNGVLIKILILSKEPSLTAMGYTQMTLMAIMMILELLVSILMGIRLNLQTPAIFIVCIKILCCCSEVKAQKLVQCAAVYSVSVFVQLALYHVDCILLALLSNPPLVISSCLVYIFALFCAVHFMSVFFTLGKLNSQRQRKRKSVCKLFFGTAQIVAFTTLFVTALCFGFIIGASGAMSSYGSHTRGPIPTLTAIITPFLFAGLGYLLKKGSSHWLKSYDMDISENSVLVSSSNGVHTRRVQGCQFILSNSSQYEDIP